MAPSTQPRHETAATPRGPVAYERWGEGEPLLLLAGLGSRTRLWGELPRRLAARFTVLAPDNRGVGGSRSGDAFTLDGAAEDAAAVLEHAGVGRAAVLGASMGGQIAALLAARDGRLVRRMVVASCGARATPSHARVLRFLRTLLDELSPERAADLFMTFAFAASFTDRYPGFVAETARLWQPDPEDLPGIRGQLAHLEAGFDLRQALAAVAVPTLVLAGALDPIVPVAATRELAAAIPGAIFRVLPEAAHSVLAEGGQALLDDTLAFLAA
jgi:3-oxoadipate enol-lactonase